MEAHPETDSSVFDTDSGLFGDDESDHAALYWDECDAVWTLVEAGGCSFDPTQLPHWLVFFFFTVLYHLSIKCI